MSAYSFDDVGLGSGRPLNHALNNRRGRRCSNDIARASDKWSLPTLAIVVAHRAHGGAGSARHPPSGTIKKSSQKQNKPACLRRNKKEEESWRTFVGSIGRLGAGGVWSCGGCWIGRAMWSGGGPHSLPTYHDHPSHSSVLHSVATLLFVFN